MESSYKTLKVILLSKSYIKMKAVKEFTKDILLQTYKDTNIHVIIECIDPPTTSDRFSQPIGRMATWYSAYRRISKCINSNLINNDEKYTYSLVISIENGIEQDINSGLWYDMCAVAFYSRECNYMSPMVFSPIKVEIPTHYMTDYNLFIKEQERFKSILQCTTFGQFISHHYEETKRLYLDHSNWMYELAGIDRNYQILEGLKTAFNMDELREQLINIK